MDFNNHINRLGTYSTQWDFVQDRFGVSGLLPFTISDMDFQTSPEIISSFQKKISHGIFGYTRWDHEDYKTPIVSWYKKRFLSNINSNWIAYAPSVIYAIVRFIQMIDTQKKGISLITPCYDGFIKISKANNFPIHTIPMVGGGISWDIFEQQIQKSKVLLLCNPNNPNGHLWTEQELTTIVLLCKKHNVFILSDDIHMDFVYKPHRFTPITQIAQTMDYLHQVAIITSTSKTFNLSSIGGAYIICPSNTIKEQYKTILKENDSLSSAMSLHIDSLIVGYNESEKWVDSLCDYIYSNLQYVSEFFNSNPNLNIYTKISDATYFSWIDCSNMNQTIEEIQKKLVHKGKVAIMEGTQYCEPLPFLRLNVACPSSKVKEGLKRLKQSFES